MPTIITPTATYYRGNLSPFSACVGYEPASSTASVIRLKFTAPAVGASHISFESEKCALAYHQMGDDNAADTASRLRWIITESDSGYENYAGSAGSLCNASYGKQLKGEAEIKLLPLRDYYLWLFPGYKGYAVWNIGSVEITLDGSYGEKSTFSLPALPLGTDTQIIINRKQEGVRHSLRVEGPTGVQILLSDSAATLVTWHTDAAACAEHMPDTNTAEFIITLQSCLNGELLGEEQQHIVRPLPADFAPALASGWVSLSPHNTGRAAGFESFIDTHSGVKAVFDPTKIDCSALRGAAVSYFTLRVNGKSYGAPYESAPIKGETSVVCSVTDTRGQTSSESFVITPEPWSAPTLSLVSVCRADPDGSENEDGNYCAVRAKLNYSSVNGENSAVLSCAYRPKDGAWGAEKTMQSEKVYALGPVSPDLSCEIRISAYDALGGTVTAIRALPTRDWALKFREDGRGLALGKAPETELKLELHESWGIQRGAEQVYFSPDILSLSLPASAWSGGSQRLSAAVKAADVLIIDTAAESAEELEDYGLLLRATAEEGSIVFTASEKPSADIKLKALVLRK